MLRTVAALAAIALALCGCAHAHRRPAAPSNWQWGMPVYPGARLAGKSVSTASFVLYRTQASLGDVYDWYVAELPAGTPHAFSASKRQATFALFDARARRTVHIEAEGSSTVILLTDLLQ